MTKIVKLSSADLGELGETDFKRWCTLGGLVATKATPDRMGWDFFVERDPLAPSMENGTPLDQRYSFHKSFVQIKSSQSSNSRIRCKLSAAHRLATTMLPSFFIYLVYGKNGVITNAYGLHLKSPEFERILKRLREAEHSGNMEIDKKFIEFNSKTMRSLMIDGSDINEFLFDEIPDILAYLNDKHKSITMSGYNEKSITGRIKFLDGASIDDLVDLSIGLKSEIDIDTMTIEKRRFGILLPGETEIIGPGKLSIKSTENRWVSMYVSSKRAGRRAKAELHAITPAILELNPDHIKFRLKNDFIEAIIYPAKFLFTFSLKPDIEKKYKIDDVVNILNFISILSYDDAFYQFNDGETLNIEDRIAEAKNIPEIAEHLYHLSNLIFIAANRISVANLIKISICEIENSLTTHPEMIKILLKEDIEFELATDNSDILKNENFRIVFPFCINFQSFCYYGASIADAVQVENAKGKIIIKTVRTRVEQDSVDLTGEDCTARANELVKSLVPKLQPAGGCLIAIDLKSDASSRAV